eukprot:982630-Karenia_brevis.AAC.1
MTLPGHVQMARDLETNFDRDAKALMELKDQDGGLPPCYWDHKIVREAAEGETVIPVGVYADGAPYSLTDGGI